MKPIIVITVQGGLVAEVNATAPVIVFVEDWDCPPDKPLVMDFEPERLTPSQERRVMERLAESNHQPPEERNHVMMNEPTNADRARWAKDALAVFTATTFSGDHPDAMEKSDLECAIGDLICDLMHFARQQDFDTGSILQQACGHFGFELFAEELPA